MRRTASPLSLILLGLGVFLLVLAPMLAWYVEPRAKRTPVDIDTTTVFKGTGSYFDTDKIKTVHDKNLTITRQVRGDVDDSNDEHAVWDVVTSVDPDSSLPAADPHDSLQFTTERWVTDRKTNRPVHCCDEKPYFEGEAYLKFPFDVQKRSYIWWDNTLGATVPLTFRGTKKIQGYEGYRFTAKVKPAKTGTRLVPGRLVGQPRRSNVLAEEWYANHGVELVADKRTGRIIYAAIGPRKTLRAPGSDKDETVLLDSKRIAFTTKTQKAQVKLADDDSSRLELIGVTLPVGAAVLGGLLAIAGGVLVLRGRRSDSGTQGTNGPGSAAEPNGPNGDTSPTTLQPSTM
ncbi:hypothetical protein GCM10010277_24110 [Streptomyces longisporoflavus]|uniref:DUF3068 domain-containing protein n=1 Tax=Streptomyces longisporoflavus TaxID=28044 RepID=UPI00167E211D|nr:DUF3068 domain-containing protein [Streptomyces longisporoflavus]GGV37547.1 hypothetical protein GCM10010277_24110 [Streptomyces longisporoflavus]